MLETRTTSNNIFLTLTYDDDHLVPASGLKIDADTGEVTHYTPDVPLVENEKGELVRDCTGIQGTLVPRDLTLFMKRLREAWRRKGYTDVRFYACGEYGSLRFRPHYHVILFNCPVDDMELDTAEASQCDFPQWKSAELEALWQKGRVRFSEVTFESCAYVARYMTKKIKGKGAADHYWLYGIEPEFSRMSRRPGIGRDYYELQKQNLLESDSIYMKKGDVAQVVRPPKYYDRLFDIDYPESKEARSARRRRNAENAKAVKMLQTSLSEREQNEMEERYLARRTKNLDLLF